MKIATRSPFRSLALSLAFGGSLMFGAVGSIDSLRGGDWTNWRGPRGTGEADDRSYPTTWSATEGIRWEYEIPGVGGSTPIVHGDRILLTTGAEGRNWVIALDSDGKELWRKDLGEERPGKHQKASGANPSPVADDEHVFVYFKSGDLACLDWDGNILWQRNLQQEFGEDTLWWDLGTSPILTSKHVVVACMHSGPSYLAAFDPKTGEIAWKQDRNLPAPEEANQSYTTPVVVKDGDRETIVTVGADHITGNDAATGEQLWSVGGLNPSQNGYFRSISSPVVAGEVVVAPYARGDSLTAVRMGGSGDVTDSHVAWRGEAISADVPTPAYHDGAIFVLNDRGRIAKLDPRDGSILAETELERSRLAFSASPIIAGGHLYAIREDGATFVVALGEKLESIAKNELGEFPTPVVASPVMVDGRILIRTGSRLYCIGD